MKTFIVKVVWPGHQFDGSTFIVDAWDPQRAISNALKNYCGITNIRVMPKWSNDNLWEVIQMNLDVLCHVKVLYTHPKKMDRNKAIAKMIEIDV